MFEVLVNSAKIKEIMLQSVYSVANLMCYKDIPSHYDKSDLILIDQNWKRTNIESWRTEGGNGIFIFKDGDTAGGIMNFVNSYPEGVCCFYNEDQIDLFFYRKGRHLSATNIPLKTGDFIYSYTMMDLTTEVSLYSNDSIKSIEKFYSLYEGYKIICFGVYFSPDGEKLSVVIDGKGEKITVSDCDRVIEQIFEGEVCRKEVIRKDSSKLVAEYKKGLKHGYEIEIRSDGKISTIIEFDEGVQVDEVVKFDKKGQIMMM